MTWLLLYLVIGIVVGSVMALGESLPADCRYAFGLGLFMWPAVVALDLVAYFFQPPFDDDDCAGA